MRLDTGIIKPTLLIYSEETKEAEKTDTCKEEENIDSVKEAEKKEAEEARGRKSEASGSSNHLHRQHCQEELQLGETNLLVRGPETELGRPSSLTPWSDGTAASPPTSSLGWGRGWPGAIQGAGGTGGLQEICIVRGGINIDSLYSQGISKRAADDSGTIGIFVPLASTKTTCGVALTSSLSNHSRNSSIILEAQQGLDTPTTTSHGITHHHENIPTKKISFT